MPLPLQRRTHPQRERTIMDQDSSLAERPSALNMMVPEFSAAMTGNQTFHLTDYKGKKIVLYFYPKDNTPGCTTEGIQFRDLHPNSSVKPIRRSSASAATASVLTKVSRPSSTCLSN
jgi:peroxiredoxin